MIYNFDKITDRRGTWSLKYDFAKERGMPEDLLPLWVADMDFPAPPEVLADIQNAVSHGVFGYTEPKGEYADILSAWFDGRFGYSVSPEEIVKTPGVVYSLAHAVKAFTSEGDSVIIQTPVYYPFYSVIADNNRKVIKNPLTYSGGKYGIDLEDFESKVKSNEVKLFLLCSPHNPVGRVWTSDELARLSGICKKYGVLVVSDEIHCDFIYPGHKHTCFGLLDENSVIATAPSKSFNLAGLQVSNIIIKNKRLRSAFKTEISKSGYSQLNTLGLVACRSAYEKGGAWLEQLNKYLTENLSLVREFLSAKLPKIKLIEPEGTYLLWLDFSAYGLTPKANDQRIISGARLWLDGGTIFGAEGAGFQRVNIACPRAALAEALDRLYQEFK
jgi:cystathionine beta-lyase